MHLYTLSIYTLFFTTGMMWFRFGAINPFQVVAIWIVAITAIRYSKDIFYLVERNVILFSLVAAWAGMVVGVQFFVETPWNTLDVAQFVTYLLLAACLAVIQFRLGREGRQINFVLCGILLIAGMYAAVFLMSGSYPWTFTADILAAISSGSLDNLIFKIFGRTGALVAEGEEFAAGMRHTLAVCMVACVFLIQFGRNGRTLRVIDIAVICALVFFVFALQSRSAWLCLVIGAAVQFGYMLYHARFTGGQLFTVATGAALSILAVLLVGDLLLERLSSTRSTDGRLGSMATNWGMIVDAAPSGVNANFVTYSAHNFIVDSGLSGGIFASLFAALIVATLLWQLGACRERPLAALLISAGAILIVRLFTAGSGLPGVGGFLALSLVFLSQLYTVQVKRARPVRRTGARA